MPANTLWLVILLSSSFMLLSFYVLFIEGLIFMPPDSRNDVSCEWIEFSFFTIPSWLKNERCIEVNNFLNVLLL